MGAVGRLHVAAVAIAIAMAGVGSVSKIVQPGRSHFSGLTKYSPENELQSAARYGRSKNTKVFRGFEPSTCRNYLIKV